LSRAQNSVARLEASVAAASDAVAEGIRARMAYAEAAGWLAHVSTWIHPNELALRDSGLRGAYMPAAPKGILKPSIPADDGFEVFSSKQPIAAALRFAKQWRRLAEFTTWRPLADVAGVRDTVDFIEWRSDPILDCDVEAWLTSSFARSEIPELISAAIAARDWMNTHIKSEPLALEAIFLGACVWREKGFGRPISLPFWSATAYRHYRLSSAVGIAWLVGFLECVAEAAQSGRHELDRLLRIEEKAATFKRTARSHLPAAINIVIRAPLSTARGLAERLNITHQGALCLLEQLVDAEIVKEATGRGAWRAFATT
jgi:HTH DNA binding domain